MKLWLIDKDSNLRILLSDWVDKIKQHVCGATFAYCSGTKEKEATVLRLIPTDTFELEV